MHVLVQKVRELAAASPDNVYNREPVEGSRCRYSRGVCSNGSVGCLLGQAFTALGYDPGPLDDDEPMSASYATKRLGIPSLDINDLIWIDEVQEFQDSSYSWSESVRIADELMYDHED